MNTRTARRLDLRQGNRSRPIPARKPDRRGGRGGQRQKAINEQREGK